MYNTKPIRLLSDTSYQISLKKNYLSEWNILLIEVRHPLRETEFNDALLWLKITDGPFIYPDVSVGGLYQFGSDASSFTSDDKPNIVLGLAYYHANRPILRFRLGGSERLYAKWVMHGSYAKNFNGSNQGFEFNLNQTLQGPHSETNIGVLLRHYLSQGSKITGLN
jgi:hypothetical protein